MTQNADQTTVSLQDAFRHALQQHQQGHLAEAETIYRQILAVAPNHADSLHLLGLIYHQVGKHRTAIELILRAIRQQPGAADYYCNLGEAHRMLGEYELAAESFLTAIDRNPQHAIAHNNLGTVLLALNRPDEAIAHYQHALQIKPGYLQALNNMASALQQKGQPADAIPYLQAVLANDASLSDSQANLALCLLDTGEQNAALDCARRARALDPEQALAYEIEAKALIRLGRASEALAALDTAPASLASRHNLMEARAEALAAQGELVAALDTLHAALRSQPGYLPLRQAIVGIAAQLSRQAAQAPEAALINWTGKAPSLSVVICSINPDRFAAVSAQYQQALAGFDHEIIGIHDARSLCEGYNRGFAQSRGELLIFSHDDVEIFDADFAPRLLRHLAQYDIIGVAGTSHLVGPAWAAAGFPHLHGTVVHKRPQDADYLVCVFGADSNPAENIEALDGFFIACRRSVFERVRFDEATFDGFHLYDVDFSFSAAQAGLRVAVANDLLMLHQSYGAYDEKWQHYADRFLAKWQSTLEPRWTIQAPIDCKLECRLPAPGPVRHFTTLARRYLATGYHQTSDQDYAIWLRQYGQLERCPQVPTSGPLISLLMPVYNPPEQWLRRALDSVLAQSYGHWQLCVADDASTASWVKPVLQEYASRDRRIEVVYRPENGHISAASNSALELVRGEWTVLFDHDDELAVDALAWLVTEISAHPDAQLVYSDEDKIDEDGQRKDAYFKPDWNYDLFLAQNLFSHMGCYRSELIRQVGGFREGYEGSQDYDLALRCIEQVPAHSIRHIPRVLYHWRILAQSMASGGDAKPYSYDAARRAIADHLARQSIAASVEPLPLAPSLQRVRYTLPDSPPLVSLIIPTRNQHALLRQCINSLARTRYPYFEVLIVDNGSDEAATRDYLDSLARRPNFRVLRDDRPFNFPALNNLAVAQARGEVLCLLNNDIEVINEDWLAEMVSQAMRPGIGAVGARLWFPDETLQHGGVLLVGGVAGHAHRKLPRGLPGYAGRAIVSQNYSAVTAACLVVRKALYQQVGGMDEALSVAFNDVDFCLKLQAAGYRNLWTPFAELYHHESASRGEETTPEKRARFASEVELMQQRWQHLLPHDPAYNPNLSFFREDFALAWPPRVAAG
ncbi:glycosyltransferase [Parachitinimonas caeni]|uniref:Glycosyltransferase n=1 Tax=Parachitinimonas caeni TaxID=3031301 RepID=A0ABT7DUU6_9NEIS|nr:glycosyltransferase [Parachitinimonas caeni]MDK2122905.1 glycosyltransferase [Parachitinimonas caeni]